MESKAKVEQRQARGFKQLRDAASNIWLESNETDRKAALAVLALANYLEFGSAFKGQVIPELASLEARIKHVEHVA